MPWEIDPAEIELLDARHLVLLLRKLVYHEAARSGILAHEVRVPASINVPDDGEDGRVSWEEGVSSTNWFPSRDCLFQAKAQHMSPADCAAEVLDRAGSVKRKVREIVKPSGAYVLFCSHSIVKKDDCVTRIRDAWSSAGLGDSAATTIKIYGADEIAQWVNTVPAADSMIRQRLGLAHARMAQDWRAWEGYDALQRSYLTTEELQSHVKAIRDALAKPKSVVRLIGLSGLGKTRLALEAFRPPAPGSDDPEQQALSESVVYAPEPTDELKEHIHAVAVAGKRAVFVVDECAEDDHRKLCDSIRRHDSTTSLLTLDHAAESVPSGKDNVIRLEQQPDDVIQGIITARYPNLSQPFVKQICEYADGFPQIAVLLTDAGLSGDVLDVGATLGTQMTNRLLYGRTAPDPAASALIRALAIFDFVGFTDEAREQFDYVVSKLWGQSHPDSEIAERVLRENFMRRGLVQTKGRFIRVTPYPLAVALAQEWWETCPERTVRELMAGTLPTGLTESMCRRFKLMGVVERARALVATLCGTDGPFGRREHVTTEVGSRLLEAMAEVNPTPVLAALSRALRNANEETIRNLPGGTRRNIVRTLELLVWWSDAFLDAASLLLDLAVVETENWANNATGVFKQLFQPYLSGTEAAFGDRLAVIDAALDSGSEKRQLLALEAISSWFGGGYWSRGGGPEQQGTRVPRRDWQPTSREDDERCRREVVQRVRRFDTERTNVGDKAREILETAVFRMLYWGWFDDIRSIVDEVSAALGEPWERARLTFEFELNRSAETLSAEAKAFATEMLGQLEPQDIADRLRSYVVKGHHMRMRRDESGGWEDLDEVRARDLAVELSHTPAVLVENARLLLEGEQGYAGVFGRTLGDQFQNPGGVIRQLLACYKEVDFVKRNPSLLMGLIAALEARDPEEARRVLAEVQADDDLVRALPALTRPIRIRSSDLSRILTGVAAERIKTADLWLGPNGVVLRELDSESVCEYFDRIAQVEASGALLAVDGFQMYLHQQTESKRLACRSCVKRLVLRQDLMELALEKGNLARYAFQGLVEFALEENPPDESFIHAILARMYEVAGGERLPAFLDLARDVLLYMLKRAPRQSMPKLIDRLAKGDLAAHTMQNALGDTGWSKREAVIDVIAEQYLWELARVSEANATVIASLVAPLRNHERDGDSTYDRWNTLSIRLINEFGSSRSVLSAIGSTLGRVSWSGSGVPVFQDRFEACRQLSKHPNAAVRKWAADYAAYFERRVTHEVRDDEEDEVRFR